MDEISNAFNNAMDKICSRCIVNQRCKDTKTKCNEWEILSAIRDELIDDEKFIIECDELVAQIKEKENQKYEWIPYDDVFQCPICSQLEDNKAPYCWNCGAHMVEEAEDEQSDIQTEE